MKPAALILAATITLATLYGAAVLVADGMGCCDLDHDRSDT